MARFNSLETKQVARINVAPIIDVALVLVIILLVTAPIISTLDMGIDLPQAATRGSEDELHLCITLNQEGEIALGEDRVPPETLGGRLRAELEQHSDRDVLVLIRADAGAPHVAVRALLETAKSAGADRIGIATRQLEGQP